MSVQTAPLSRLLEQNEVVPKPEKPRYNVALGYLRAFVTVLVLLHHSVLAYHPFAPAPPTSLVAQPRWWQAFPVVDTRRWSGFALLTGFNDIFFMSLMFFLSGLFVWQSLERKSSGRFLRDRLRRLGLPFIGAALLAPLAYYPAYLESGQRGWSGFWRQWSALGNWPAGPAWFVWVLLAFDVIAATLFAWMPLWGDSLGRLLSRASARPVVFFATLVAASALVYVPMALAFSPFQWSEFGPFFFQTSRILHYLMYFLIAVGVGAYGLGRGLLVPDGKLARRWLVWSVVAMLLFGVTTGVSIVAITAKSSLRMWETVASLGFSVSCAGSSFAFLALFLRLARTPRRIFDSLRDNAYGMYLIHYACVSWLQYAVLKVELTAPMKALMVFVGTLAVSWSATAFLRRIPAVAHTI